MGTAQQRELRRQSVVLYCTVVVVSFSPVVSGSKSYIRLAQESVEAKVGEYFIVSFEVCTPDFKPGGTLQVTVREHNNRTDMLIGNLDVDVTIRNTLPLRTAAAHSCVPAHFGLKCLQETMLFLVASAQGVHSQQLPVNIVPNHDEKAVELAKVGISLETAALIVSIVSIFTCGCCISWCCWYRAFGKLLSYSLRAPGPWVGCRGVLGQLRDWEECAHRNCSCAHSKTVDDAPSPHCSDGNHDVDIDISDKSAGETTAMSDEASGSFTAVHIN